jgi:hypothetical protein
MNDINTLTKIIRENEKLKHIKENICPHKLLTLIDKQLHNLCKVRSALKTINTERINDAKHLRHLMIENIKRQNLISKYNQYIGEKDWKDNKAELRKLKINKKTFIEDYRSVYLDGQLLKCIFGWTTIPISYKRL